MKKKKVKRKSRPIVTGHLEKMLRPRLEVRTGSAAVMRSDLLLTG